MALLAGGGYAEKVAVHEGSVLPVPTQYTMAEAGAFMEVCQCANVFITRWLFSDVHHSVFESVL